MLKMCQTISLFVRGVKREAVRGTSVVAEHLFVPTAGIADVSAFGRIRNETCIGVLFQSAQMEISRNISTNNENNNNNIVVNIVSLKM